VKQNYTPMMQQYLKIKEDYADAIVFFRLGDFYEMFFDDAILASKVLEIALTSRDAGEKVPMCGVPFHAVKPYIQKLIEKGFKIALVEQVSEPGKGLVERKVVRLITPGTVFEDGILDANSHNFIGNIALTEKGYALTYVDISTGEAFLTDGLEKFEIVDYIYSLKIKEIVCPPHFDQKILDALQQHQVLVSISSSFDIGDHKYLQNLDRDQKRAASHLLNYLKETQQQNMAHLMPFELVKNVSHMHIDFRVKKHLEIQDSLTNQDQTTLIYWLNHCQTAMGSRYLKHMFNHPLYDEDQLNERYDLIDAFGLYQPRQNVLESLRYIYDINRIVGRVAFRSVNARDLYQLKETLKYIPILKNDLHSYQHPIVEHLIEQMDSHDDLYLHLNQAIVDEPPLTIKDGNIIKEGYSETLDALRNINHDAQTWLSQFEIDEREKTGIKNLKVGYNRVFGYYIEISKGQTQFVDDSFGYERKQTLTNSERYISPILKEKEEMILHAKEKAIAMEYELFVELRSDVERYAQSLQVLSTLIAKIDVFLNLAVMVEKYRLVRPNLTKERQVKIVKGRHLVVEQFTKFIENDIMMEPGEIFLITGPNMSGKSTYMRMFALMVYMAQSGSYVPAESATMPIYDALFTRIGSSDDLSGGKSTFMVEMVESNEALTRATNKSLILFDEIGRGTATYDGMALAQGMIEYIHEKIGAQTLFSTHYHELTFLEQTLSRCTNLCVKAKEEKNTMVFLHHVEKGTTDKSYGIQVASLAHLPKILIERSQDILKQLEAKEQKVVLDLFNYDDYESKLEQTLSQTEIDVLNEIEALKTDEITPLDALLLMKHLQSNLKKK